MPQIVAGIRAGLDEAGDVPLLLENSAGQGGTVGRDVDELADVIDAVGDPRLGLCLDSCHLFVSGVDVRERPVIDLLLQRIDHRVGIDRLQALHVNDAAAGLGSNLDRHANLGQGELGVELGSFLGHPSLQGLPAVVETAGAEGKGADAAEMAMLRKLHDLGVSAGGATISPLE
jgi:deoxyribonuclease-4